jgi:hypothetical protein
MMRWSRPEIYNAVREISIFMTTGASDAHMRPMKRVMEYCVETKDRGLLLNPDVKWNGDTEFKVVLCGISDSNFAKDPESWKSVSRNSTFLCGATVIQRNTMHIIVEISVTEAKLFAAINNAQDMLYKKRIIESLGLHVQLPMTL